MAEYDLTSKVGQYLDRHLVFPLIEFLSGKKIYDEDELLQGKIDLLQDTNMVDFAMDEYKRLHEVEEVPEAMVKKREVVVQNLKELIVKIELVTAALESDDFKNFTQTTRDGRALFEYLKTNFNITREMVEDLYNYAKIQYECGNYEEATEYLYIYKVLDEKNSLSAMWGRLASEILLQHWDPAMEEFSRLKEVIDGDSFSSPLKLLQQRTWLIHWSLFIFFNHPKGRDKLIEMFLYQPQYLNALQTTCPHILRYLTTAVITSKNRRQLLKDLVKVIQQESYTYRDPITEFIECLYVNFDFDGAQKKLRECEQVLVNDFFLIACRDDFIENARLFIFETFCRIHQCISISMLAEKLNMTPEDAEKWIVNLIRNATLDAKIDSKEGHVVMGTQAASVQQQVIEKTKSTVQKTQHLMLNMAKRLAPPAHQVQEPFAMVWSTDM
ncbi:eukaryotic translation initiation factor 3 subunit E-like [Rhopilema esculentum]|uniref:eukaryotic translation initiation factor 3 subunit E-like n=1 Tax=Rhopilema esculentum TaxID=499914 RepID=UPI0031D9EAF8